ncbi:MAG: glycosyltransferase family 39 protein [Anaerolineales bacterium]|nr:glycosyltransferase family 39 protein [Anaerolineales bacterium]
MKHYHALAVVLVLAVAWRVVGINWDNYGFYHPDERFLRDVTEAIGDTGQLLPVVYERCANDPERFNFFNARCSALNPNNIQEARFAYGTLPVFIVKGAASLVAEVQDDELWRSDLKVQLVGRGINVVAEALAIVFLYLIGYRLMGSQHGLLAAMLYAGAVLPIQQAHFWTVDTIAHLFFIMTLYFAVVISQNARVWWPYIGFGLAIGCAAASRANLVVAVVLAPIAVAIEFGNGSPDGQRHYLGRVMVRLGVAGVLAFLIFRLAQPYAFVGPDFLGFIGPINTEFPFVHLNWNPEWREDLSSIANYASQQNDSWPPSQQWMGRPAYLYPWFNFLWGMGATLFVMGTLGVVTAIIRQLHQHQLSPEVGLLSLWFLLYFGWQGQLHYMTLRYYLPLYSVFCLLAVWWVEQIRWRKPLRIMLVGGTFLWAMAFTAIYRTTPTRVEAAVWMRDHIPAAVEGQTPDGDWVPLQVQDSDSVFLYTLYASHIDPRPQLHPIAWKVDRTLLLNHVQIHWLEDDAGQVQAVVRIYTILPEGRRLLHETVGTSTGRDLAIDMAAEQALWLRGGTYEWEVDLLWANPEVVLHVLPMVDYYEVSSGAYQQVALPLMSAYNRVPYSPLGVPNTTVLIAEQPITLLELNFIHQLGPAVDLSLWLRNDPYNAHLVDVVPMDSLLGESRRYRLDPPLSLAKGDRAVVSASDAVFITSTAIATDGRWDTSAPERICWTDKPIGYVAAKDCPFYSGYDYHWYVELPLDMVEPDSPQKMRYLQDVLQKADYYTIATNRMYDALPRNARLYPYMGFFYDALFNGDLGYQQLARFATFPRLGPLVLPDQVLPDMGLPRWFNELEAEEAFTVYDHPTIYIFQRTDFIPEKMPSFASLMESNDQLDSSIKDGATPFYEVVQ